MVILVTGSHGMLGSEVVEELKTRSIEVIATDISDNAEICLDITNRRQVFDVVKKYKPDAIMHLAAWTKVDNAEDEDNKKTVYEINVDGTRNIVDACREINTKILYTSTDYVFNGEGDKPWTTEDIPCNSVNYYGYTKLEGENIVKEYEKSFITRIQWTYGKNGKNFIKTMIDVGKAHKEVRVVNDQIGTPTYVVDLAKALVDLICSDKYGIYHIANEGGYVSWYEYCIEIYKQYGLNTKVIPVTTEEYGLSKAKRPLNSRLDKTKLTKEGFISLPNWRDAIKRYLKEEFQK